MTQTPDPFRLPIPPASAAPAQGPAPSLPVPDPKPVPLPGERPPSGLFVHLSMLIALALTVVAVGLVGWRWLVVRFPNAAIVARGDASADGVEVVVRADNGREVARGRLTPANGYEFAVLVEQGVYAVRASKDDKTFVDQRCYVPDARAVLAAIVVPPELRPTTRPATRPGGPADVAEPVVEP
jgi:hypothetical protein